MKAIEESQSPCLDTYKGTSRAGVMTAGHEVTRMIPDGVASKLLMVTGLCEEIESCKTTDMGHRLTHAVISYPCACWT